jgi:hypothetical protein
MGMATFSGAAATALGWAASTGPHGAEDFDGDGKSDIFWQDTGSMW